MELISGSSYKPLYNTDVHYTPIEGLRYIKDQN